MDERDELLAAVQAALTDAIGKVDEICRKHDIPYWLDWGTMLGAVRHHGFIPWDDDIDLGMMREDYERLRQVDASEWAEKGLTLIDPSDDDYRHDKLFARIYVDGTQIQSYCDLDWQIRQTGEFWSTGLLIDIYPYDWVPSDEQQWLADRQRVIDMKYKYKYLKFAKVPHGKGMAALKAQVRRIQGALESARHPDAWKDLVAECERIAASCDERTLIGCYYVEETSIARPASTFFPTVDMPFGNLSLPVPHEWDALLTDAYGDYMTPPPENQRTHIDFIYADLGPYGKFVLDTPAGSLGAKEAAQG